MPVINIPGVGDVEFPDSMSSDDINAAAKRLYDDAHQKSAESKPTGGVLKTASDEHSDSALVGVLPAAGIVAAPVARAVGSGLLNVATTPGATEGLAGTVGRAAPVVGYGVALNDLYQGHPVKAFEHAVEGYVPRLLKGAADSARSASGRMTSVLGKMGSWLESAADIDPAVAGLVLTPEQAAEIQRQVMLAQMGKSGSM